MPVSQTRIRVRYAETDQMGVVVYYANFFIWYDGEGCHWCGDKALTDAELVAQGSEPHNAAVK